MNEDVYDILINEYGLTAEDVDALVNAGVLQGQTDLTVPREYSYAKELRGVDMPQGREVGGVYEAAHPLEFVGAGLERMAGMWGERKARQKQEDILKNQAALRAKYLRGMGGQGGAPRGSVPGGPVQSNVLAPPTPTPTRVPLDFSQGNPYGKWMA